MPPEFNPHATEYRFIKKEEDKRVFFDLYQRFNQYSYQAFMDRVAAIVDAELDVFQKLLEKILDNEVEFKDIKEYITPEIFELMSIKLFLSGRINFDSLVTLLIMNNGLAECTDISFTDLAEYKVHVSPRQYEAWHRTYVLTLADEELEKAMTLDTFIEAVFSYTPDESATELDQLIANRTMWFKYGLVSNNEERMLGQMPTSTFNFEYPNYGAVIPPYGFIRNFFQHINMIHIKPMPLCGVVSSETLLLLLREGKHPLALYSYLVRRNYGPVHRTFTHNLTKFLHDLWHHANKCFARAEDLEFILNTLVPAVDAAIKLCDDKKQVEILEELHFELFDFNTGQTSSLHIGEARRHEDYLVNFITDIFYRMGSITSKIGDQITFTIKFENGEERSFGKGPLQLYAEHPNCSSRNSLRCAIS